MTEDSPQAMMPARPCHGGYLCADIYQRLGRIVVMQGVAVLSSAASPSTLMQLWNTFSPDASVMMMNPLRKNRSEDNDAFRWLFNKLPTILHGTAILVPPPNCTFINNSTGSASLP